MGKASVKSMYIHIPFCKKICSYCDFCKNYYDEKMVKKYLLSLKKEISKWYENNYLDTLYIGGGTPSSLSLDELNTLFDILKIIKLNNNYEYSFECNYEDISEELLIILKRNRVNRLSIGIETLNDSFSQFLNRSINKNDMINKINLAKKYFDNINVDIMYAIPNQSIKDILNDLSIISKLDVNHISTYALIKENNTLLSINNIKEVDDEVQSSMYYEIKKYLEKKGYKHYETSNYAKKGYESKHNLTYWNNDEYYGFGAGASSFLHGIRKDNTRSISNYINGNVVYNEEKVTNEQLLKDEVMLGLRKIDGINKADFYLKYNKKIEEIFDYQRLVKDELLTEDNNCIKINDKYLFVSNTIILDFIDTYKY